MGRAVRVLHVDDEEGLLELTAEFLERENEDFDVVSETNVRDALGRIDDGDVDCVVSDYQMPDLDGIEFLERVRASDPSLPFVLFTGQGSEEVASDAITAGATDYLRKQTGMEQYRLLANRIENAVASHRAERELARYEALVETVGDPMYVLDEDGIVTMANRAMAQMLDASREAVAGTHASEFLAEGDFEWGTDLIVELLEDPDRNSATYEVTVETTSGGEFFGEINVAPLLTDAGEYRATVGVVRDVSERKRREQRLLDREHELEQYETIVQTIPDEVYTLDADGHFTSVVSPKGQRRTQSGHRPPELLGEHVSIVMDADDIETAESLIRELLGSPDREKVSFEMDLLSREGERLPHENHVALLGGSDGEAFRGTVGVLRDISDRKRRERELERQNERLEEFARIASHDLRNPLNVATGKLQLARDEVDCEHLADVATQLERMETIIGETLSMARQSEPVTTPEPVDLAAIAGECWEAVATGDARIDIATDATVRADRDRFRRVLENLFRNSVEQADETVHVRVRDAGDDGFSVEDDGPGIPEQARDSLFDPGFTTDPDGTGFGLAIVEEIVEAHGWEIDVQEGESGGARFVISGVETVDD